MGRSADESIVRPMALVLVSGTAVIWGSLQGPEGLPDGAGSEPVPDAMEGRMKTLLVALLLLVVGTGTAFAECAWVLWGAQRPHEGTTDARAWWVLAAYATRQECESRRAVIHRQRTSDDTSYECLPGTVDPRGPKGK